MQLCQGQLSMQEMWAVGSCLPYSRSSAYPLYEGAGVCNDTHAGIMPISCTCYRLLHALLMPNPKCPSQLCQ